MNHTRRTKRRFPHNGYTLINEFGKEENSLAMRARFIRELAERQKHYGKRSGRKK